MSTLVLDDSRYARQTLITWWDQEKLRDSRVLVVGAGALGNEIVKNLTLVGVGTIEIVDMDNIEHSNLARCVFFDESSEGSDKATVLAAQAHRLNPDVVTVAHVMPVQQLGAAYLRHFDLVIGALDNREARLWVNQACRKLGKWWIDGAIEGLRGLARVFAPTGPCYECTLTESDYVQMSHRRSCSLLAPEEILSGKTPTNATTSSVIAGVQSQEAIKILVGNLDLVSLSGKCWVFTGDTMDTYVTKYREDDECLSHDFYESVAEANGANSLRDLASFVDQMGGIDAWDFEEDLIELRPCSACGGDTLLKVRSSMTLGEGLCATCGEARVGSISTQLAATSEHIDTAFRDLGLGLEDFVTLRFGSKRLHLMVRGE
jgi:adenylyltransferase/sulfurtransferase